MNIQDIQDDSNDSNNDSNDDFDVDEDVEETDQDSEDDYEDASDLGNFTYFNDLDKKFLIRNNYIFKWYSKNKDDSEYWLCRRCLKHSVTVARDLIVNENSHNVEDEDEDTCVYTEAELLCEQAIVRIRRRCLKEITPIPEIYDDELTSLNELLSSEVISIYIKPFKSMRSTLYNIRKKTIPNIPTSTDEIDLNEEYTHTTFNKRFLLFDTNDDDRAIGFCSEAGLEKLAKSDQWHIDGTFKAAPLIYYQLIIIHAYLYGFMFSCCYILVKNKDYNIYKKVI
jgi:hypothetical protein